MFSVNEDKFLNQYNFLEWIWILWINICSLNEYISLKVNNYIIFLKLNRYYSLKLHKYTVAGCKMMPWIQIYFVECEYKHSLIFTTNSQPQSYLSGHTNKYKLWFSSSLRTLRAEASCSNHKKCFCVPTTNPPLLFTENFRSRLYSMRTSRKTDFLN